MKIAIVLTGLIFLICQPESIHAQNYSVEPGDKVRITLSNTTVSRTIGILKEAASDSIIIMKRDEFISYPVNRIIKFEVSEGLKRRGGRGAAIGAVTGGLLFGIVGAASGSSSSSSDDFYSIDLYSPGEGFAAGLLAGGVLGAVVGGVIGHSTRTDQWKQVSIERVSINVPDQITISGLGFTYKVNFQY